jgi:hypothetical protein
MLSRQPFAIQKFFQLRRLAATSGILAAVPARCANGNLLYRFCSRCMAASFKLVAALHSMQPIQHLYKPPALDAAGVNLWHGLQSSV